MAEQVNGYRKLLAPQYDTYDHWRDYALNHGINVDFSYGNQCWDSCALLWYQYGLQLQTGNGQAYGCWTLRRNQNAVFPFEKVGSDSQAAMARKTLIKRGDCVVFAPSGLNYTGHIAFADEDYNGPDSLNCLGQNQGQGYGWGKASNIKAMNLRNFLGAFRNHNWATSEPTPVVKRTVKDDRFPFVLYARKFRQKIR